MSENEAQLGKLLISINVDTNEINITATEIVTPKHLAKIGGALLNLAKKEGGKTVFNEAIIELSKECDCESCKEERLLESKLKTINPMLN